MIFLLDNVLVFYLGRFLIEVLLAISPSKTWHTFAKHSKYVQSHLVPFPSQFPTTYPDPGFKWVDSWLFTRLATNSSKPSDFSSQWLHLHCWLPLYCYDDKRYLWTISLFRYYSNFYAASFFMTLGLNISIPYSS